MLIADDLDRLLNILPDFVKNPLQKHPNKKYLIEVVMDLGRRPEARFPKGPEYLSNVNISWHDLDFCIKKIPNFGADNRSGIESTLHRISSIKNRRGNIVGLTCRVGRAIFGTIGLIRDLLYSGSSILLLGKPGVGKTTAIREITRVLADEMEKRVVIIDTSNEIAGDGDIPHPAIGRARRMQVTKPELQHQVMIEAVENHMPEVIIIDEIGTELEALAARTIAERGVQLVGTAHGNHLESVIKNPTLSDLIGGIQYVTLGDDEAKRRGSQKSILERKAVPAFQIAIEIHQRNNWVIHEKVDFIVDQLLQGSNFYLQRRISNHDGSISINCESFNSTEFIVNNKVSSIDNLQMMKKSNVFSLYSVDKNAYHEFNKLNTDLTSSSRIKQGSISFKNIRKNINNTSYLDYIKSIRLYVYGINLQQIEETIIALNLSIALTRDIMKADCILALRSYVKHDSKIRHLAKSKRITIYTIHNNGINNLVRALKQILNVYTINYKNWKNLCAHKSLSQLNVLFETRCAIEKIVLVRKQSIELLPQADTLRQLQSKLINMYNLRYSTFSYYNTHKLIIYPI
uniref:AAA+ ATPase domain-containing protein n=1 Tax=Kuetzingia canaliculata TaxID=228262 RepID=A0A1Z1MQ55_KUECA|nr:hypothetical protein [Kuetzingia canaliculata]ARW67901.1 hypothetical protein [Kuetzingia canaliculata]